MIGSRHANEYRKTRERVDDAPIVGCDDNLGRAGIVGAPRDAFAASREALPADVSFLRHIGIYSYRAGFLRRFAALPRTPLEQVESLEQLRALEHGHRIAVRETPAPFPPGVDTLEDLARAEAHLAAGDA